MSYSKKYRDAHEAPLEVSRRSHSSVCTGGLAHHWVISSPVGEPSVPGRCKKCGAEKSFLIDCSRTAWSELSEHRFKTAKP